MRTCTGPCGRTLPATSDHFYMDRRRGIFRAKCRQCHNAERPQRWQVLTPEQRERRRAVRRATYEAAREQRERAKANAKFCALGGSVDATAFREWLISNEQFFADRTAMAGALGIGFDLMCRVMNGQRPRVAFDTVDTALTRYGPLTVDDMYPMSHAA